MINANINLGTTPTIQRNRSKFKIKGARYKTGALAGYLNPLPPIRVLPGDTFNINVNTFIRMTASKFVPEDDIRLDMYFFWVPDRIVWNHYKEWLGENKLTKWDPIETHRIPIIKVTTRGGLMTSVGNNSILRHMGFPNRVGLSDSAVEISAIPVRGYNFIWNEYFRSEAYQDPKLLNFGDNPVNYSYADSTVGGNVLRVNRAHDYFSSVLPAPQSGDGVNIPIGPQMINEDTNTVIDGLIATEETGVLRISPEPSEDNSVLLQLGSIRELRIAYQTQRLMESYARNGRRMRQILKALFGVNINESVIDIPEYLGGSSLHINMAAVAQTSESSSTATMANQKGSVSGLSQTSGTLNGFFKSFTEHGYIIPVYCFRSERTYSQGADKFWFKRDFLEEYNPIFNNIGDLPVYTREIYIGQNGTSSSLAASNDVWGYQEAWSEYRYFNPKICGVMDESLIQNWTYADMYNTKPVMSETWLEEGYLNINRTLSVSGNPENVPQFICDFLFTGSMVRVMTPHSIPGLSDHF